MNKNVIPAAQAFELLRFIIPKPPRLTVEILNSPNGKIVQHYECSDTQPDIISMREYHMLSTSQSVFHYLFKIRDNDLILQSLSEKTHSGEVFAYKQGYPYIRFPEKDERVPWTYCIDENIRIKCISCFVRQQIEESEHDMLIVVRKMIYLDKSATDAFVNTECYIAGQGIQSREKTNDILNHLIWKTELLQSMV